LQRPNENLKEYYRKECGSSMNEQGNWGHKWKIMADILQCKSC